MPREYPSYDPPRILLSAEDADLGTGSRWYKHPLGYVLRAYEKGETTLLHRLVMERVVGRRLKRSEVVDHFDHVRDNNRRENLRLVTTRVNVFHRKGAQSNSDSGERNVSFDRGKWVVSVSFAGAEVFRGRFDTEHDAEIAAFTARHIVTHYLQADAVAVGP